MERSNTGGPVVSLDNQQVEAESKESLGAPIAVLVVNRNRIIGTSRYRYLCYVSRRQPEEGSELQKVENS